MFSTTFLFIKQLTVLSRLTAFKAQNQVHYFSIINKNTINQPRCLYFDCFVSQVRFIESLLLSKQINAGLILKVSNRKL